MSSKQKKKASNLLTLDTYLSEFIEGYLFSDIDAMMAAKPDDKNHRGALGYPLLVTVSSGMETLGRLAYPLNKNGESQVSVEGQSLLCFQNYWMNFFQMQDISSYRFTSSAFYSQVRNGIVHNYILPYVVVSKANTGWHLMGYQNFTFVDSTTYAQHFKTSYGKDFKSWLKKDNMYEIAEKNWSTVINKLESNPLAIYKDESRWTSQFGENGTFIPGPTED